jgi:hypothetical protein
VVKCHAGCSVDDILAALSLARSDLFDESRQAKQGRVLVAEYPYCDETGEVLYIKVRFWPKDFRQYVPLPGGGKQWNLNGVRAQYYIAKLYTLRMSDTQLVSGAARQMAAQRWGSQKPVRLARELELRADELPAVERRRLLDALTQHIAQEQSP